MECPRAHVGDEHHHGSVEPEVFGSEGRLDDLYELHCDQTGESVVAAPQEDTHSTDQEEVLHHCRIQEPEDSEQDDQYEDKGTQQQPFVVDHLKGPPQRNRTEDTGSVEGDRNVG